MPNHVYYIMGVSGDQTELKKFFDTHITKEEGKDYFDFDTIIPFPEELVGTTSPNRPPRVLNGKVVEGFGIAGAVEAAPGTEVYEKWEKESKRLKNLYGFDNWYDWKCTNQGTKWGAYDFEWHKQRKNYFTFQTAWSTPDPIFEELADMYPGLRFEIDVIEESGGFSGNINIANGEVDENLTNDYEQWKQWACDIIGWCDFEEE